MSANALDQPPVDAGDSSPAPSAAPLVAPAPKPVRTKVTFRAANLDGKIPILQYHHVAEKEGVWTRSRQNFAADLARLHRLGYRPVTVSEYLKGEMDLPPGASPVILTFDDSHPNQFRMLPDGRIDPDCAVGIWLAFAEKHPDFPVKGTFFAVPTMAFGQKKWLAKKMELLKAWGSDVQIHTVTHANLATLTDEQIKAEIVGSIEWIRQFGFEPNAIALPYGVLPKNRVLLKEFLYKGRRYHLDAAFLAGAEPAFPSTSERFRPYRIPRILAMEGDYGSTFWLNLAKAGKVPLYVAP